MIAYKFVDWDVPGLITLKNSKPYQIKEKVLAREKLSREEKDYLYTNLRANNFSKTGIPLHGWMFGFLPWLRLYYVEYNYSHIQKVWSPDKMAIRNNIYESEIVKITEIIPHKKGA